MMLIVHIMMALSSIGLATYAYARPSAAKLWGAYGLVAATLATGTYLVVLAPAHLASACTSGLIYLALVATALVMAGRRLTSISNDNY